MISRRGFLAGAAAVALVPAVGGGQQKRRGFRFVHMTDLHMREGQGARDGIALAVAKVAALNPAPDFVIVGGDVCDGLMGGPSPWAEDQYRWAEQALAGLNMPIHYVVGNHDIVGWGRSKDRSGSDPKGGKQRFLDRFVKGPAYQSFSHKGAKVLLLDSIQPAEGKFPYRARIDDDQLQWMKSELESADGGPVFVAVHCPVASSFTMFVDDPSRPAQAPYLVENAREVHELFRDHNVQLVLQGHTHVAECVDYAGRRHITSGAVCGSWWQGKRLGVDPEGFSVIDYNPDQAALTERVQWTYKPTGWVARA